MARRPSPSDLAHRLDRIESDEEHPEFVEVLFVDSGGEVWARSTEDGIEPVEPDQYDDVEIEIVADFTGTEGAG